MNALRSCGIGCALVLGAILVGAVCLALWLAPVTVRGLP